MNKGYQFVLNQEDDNTTLLIHGDIVSEGGWFTSESDVGAFGFAKELAEVKTANLTIQINSYGGEVAQGLAIYNLLKQFKGHVKTVNDGFACSAASVVFMAGDERIMPKSSLLMIHNAWSSGAGDSNAFRKMADDLEKITKPSVEIYKANSNLSEKAIMKMMDEETWITAEEALEYGFATSVIEADAKQSLSDHFLEKLVRKNKELEKQLENKEAELQTQLNTKDGKGFVFF